ncbi:acyltransferase [Candidatus Saccharibacteria bacterium]|nr:acyltransferase [Candidatus Saccharibacteria bacterium]
MVQGKRLKYIDVARGIAMGLIVFSHAISATSVHAYPVYRFLFFINVPIFFVLSGFTFRVKSEETFWQFFKNKFLRIMLPYFVWALVFLIPYLVFGGEIIEKVGQSSSFDFWQQIGNVFYGNGVNNALKQNGPLWFLPALFATEMLFYFVVRFVKDWKWQTLVFVMTILVGYLCTLFADKFYLPWGINSALTIGVFFYFGYLLKEWKVFGKMPLKLNLMITILTVALCGVAMHFNAHENVVWADYQYRNYLLTIIAGLTSAWVIIQISRLINKNRILECVGINTMAILIFHKIVIVVAQTKLGGFSEMMVDSNLFLELVLSFAVGVIATAVSIIVGAIFRKVCPFLIGEKRKKGEILRN